MEATAKNLKEHRIELSEMDKHYPGFMYQFTRQLNKEINDIEGRGNNYPMITFNIMGVEGEFVSCDRSKCTYVPTFCFRVKGDKIGEKFMFLSVIG